jgi:tetratricopeptide (TPR) repeat protein
LLDLTREISGDPGLEPFAVLADALEDDRAGKTRDALAGFAKAAGGFEATGQTLFQALALYRLGKGAFARKDYPQAAESLEQALELARQLGQPEKQPLIAICLRDLALTLGRLEQYDRAVRLLRQAVELFRDSSPQDIPSLACGLATLANLHVRLRSYTRAQECYEQLLRLLYRVHANAPCGHVEIACCLMRIGCVLRLQEEYGRAQGYFEQALAMRRLLYRKESYPQGSGDLLEVYSHLAEVLMCLGETSRALEVIDEGLQTLDLASDADLATLPDVARLSPASALPLLRGEILFGQLTDEAGASDLRRCEAVLARAAGLHDALNFHMVPKSGAGGSGTTEPWVDLMARRVGLLGRLYQVEGDSVHLRRAFAVAELCRIWQQQDVGCGEAWRLGDALPQGHPWRTPGRRPPVCTVEEARDLLNPNEVALLFIAGPEQSQVVVVEQRPASSDPAEGLAVYPLPPCRELEELIKGLVSYRTLSSVERSRQRGAEVYRKLLAPLAEQIRGKDLLIVTNGKFGDLPFEVLVEPDPSTGHQRFLIEGRRIRYAPSLTALAGSRDAWDKPSGMAPLWPLDDKVSGGDCCLPALVPFQSRVEELSSGERLQTFSVSLMTPDYPSVLLEFWPVPRDARERLLGRLGDPKTYCNHCEAPSLELQRNKQAMIRAGEPPLHWAGMVAVGE